MGPLSPGSPPKPPTLQSLMTAGTRVGREADVRMGRGLRNGAGSAVPTTNSTECGVGSNGSNPGSNANLLSDFGQVTQLLWLQFPHL